MPWLYEVLDILSEHVGTASCSKRCVNERTLLCHLQNRVVRVCNVGILHATLLTALPLVAVAVAALHRGAKPDALRPHLPSIKLCQCASHAVLTMPARKVRPFNRVARCKSELSTKHFCTRFEKRRLLARTGNDTVMNILLHHALIGIVNSRDTS